MARLRPSPAMLVALLALFVALGSSSMAEPVRSAAKRLITGKQVKNGSLSERDLSRRARARLRGSRGPAGPSGARGPAAALAPGSVGGPEVADNSLGGADILESSLGEVPEAAQADDAQTLDNLDSLAFARGNGVTLRATRSVVAAGSTATVHAVSGKYQLTHACPATPFGNNGTITLTPANANTTEAWVDDGSADVTNTTTSGSDPVTSSITGNDHFTIGAGLLFASTSNFVSLDIYTAHSLTTCVVYVSGSISTLD